jgi:uncharacterized membrane protein
MNNNQPHNQSQEIDLSNIQGSIFSFFRGIEKAIYATLRFVLRNIILLVILLGIGLAIGYYLDNKKFNSYKHEVIVIPNIENKSYLYKAVENFRFMPKDDSIVYVSVEPLIDVNHFVSRGNGLEIAKYLSENNIQIDDHKKGNQTELMYKYHLITIYTAVPDTDGAIVSSYINSLATDDFLVENFKVNNENVKFQLREYEESVEDINRIFKKLGEDTAISEIKIGIDSQSDDLLQEKKSLISDINRLKNRQVEETSVIKEVSRFSNIQEKSTLFTFGIPFLLIGIFLVIVWLRRVHKKYQLD